MDETGTTNQDQEETLVTSTAYETQNTEFFYDENDKKKPSFFLYCSSLTANLLLFDCGCNFTWTSPAMSTLKSTNPEVNPLGSPITTFQQSWIIALVTLGGTVGPILFGKLADIYGRKKMLMAIAVFKIKSYCILAFAHNVAFYYLARFLLGLGMGLTFALMPVFTREISDNSNRGKFGALLSAFVAFGMLYTLSIGPLFPLKLFTLTYIIFLTTSLIGFVVFIPETPIYMISNGNKPRAKKIVMKLKKVDSEAAEHYLSELTKREEEKISNKCKFSEKFKSRGLRRSMMICTSLCSLQQLSGMLPIMTLIGSIFQITSSKISMHTSVVIISILIPMADILSSSLIDRVGTRPLLLISATGTSTSLALLGSYFYLQRIQSSYLESIFWLPVMSLIIFTISFGLGLSSVPLAIIGEIFPSKYRAMASSFVTFNAAFIGFTVTFSFPIVMDFLGGAKCFWLFSGFNILGGIFIYFQVPETKGKSDLEIQNILSKPRTQN